jgi:hypothetical protein
MSKDHKFTVHSTDNVLTLCDQNPGIEEHHAQVPEYVDHEMDFRTMRYRRTAVFHNDDPWAESDTSQASQGFLVRRTDSGAWEAQLVTRNFVTLDTPGEWERVPPWLATAWEEAWRCRSH